MKDSGDLGGASTPFKYFFDMPLLDGALSTWIQRPRVYTADVVLIWVKDALHGLHYLHSNQMAHLDIKPDNLLIASTGHLLLADFGAAQNIDDIDITSPVGTLLYSPPELYLGNRCTYAADIWSLGLTVAETMRGRRMFSVVLQRNENTDAQILLLRPIITKQPLEMPIYCSRFHATEQMLRMTKQMLLHEPSERPTATQFWGILAQQSLSMQLLTRNAQYATSRQQQAAATQRATKAEAQVATQKTELIEWERRVDKGTRESEVLKQTADDQKQRLGRMETEKDEDRVDHRTTLQCLRSALTDGSETVGALRMEVAELKERARVAEEKRAQLEVETDEKIVRLKSELVRAQQDLVTMPKQPEPEPAPSAAAANNNLELLPLPPAFLPATRSRWWSQGPRLQVYLK